MTTTLAPKTTTLADGTEVIVDGTRAWQDCNRCGGSGEYSYCPRFGTVCFDCQGKFDAISGRTGGWVSLADAQRRAKRRVTDWARRERKAAEQAIGAEARANALVEAHPLLAELFYRQEGQHVALWDMGSCFARKGTLSDKQIAFAEKLIREGMAAQAKLDAAPPVVAAPTAKGVKVTGEVMRVRVDENRWGGVETKMRVQTAEGWRLWVTVPASIRSAVKEGDTVELVVDVTRSDDDESFAFGSRPRQARVIAA